MLTEFTALRKMAIRVLVFFSVSSFLALVLSWGTLGAFSLRLPWPVAGGQTIPASFINDVRENVLPEGAVLAEMSPMDAFVVNLAIAAAAGAIVTFFFALWQVWRFMRPGLYASERRGFVFIALASAFLFWSGCLFAYRVLIPAVYAALYGFTPSAVIPLYNLRETMWQVLGMLVATGVAFLLPVLMVLLSVAGVITPAHWRTYARHAIVIVLVLSAILTPDGSGISMFLLALPICALYTLGYLVSVQVLRMNSSRV